MIDTEELLDYRKRGRQLSIDSHWCGELILQATIVALEDANHSEQAEQVREVLANLQTEPIVWRDGIYILQ